jgi:hypothetical protein
METKILPRAQRVGAVAAPQNDVASEKPRRANLSCREVRGLRNGVPIVKKNWVVDHGSKCTGFGGFLPLRYQTPEARGAREMERRIARLNRSGEKEFARS